MVRILVVDDDPKLRGYVREGLADSGIESDEAPHGEAAIELLTKADPGHYDLLLLDVMMPGASGWEVLEQLRKQQNQIPTIFVTARDAVEERVKGLELGADDYIIKPFEFSELLARVEAVIRRREHIPIIQRGPLTFDLVERSVELEGKTHELSTKEFDLLLVLARANGEVVGRAELLKSVWGIEFDPETNMVDVIIARLRRRLRPAGAELIRTVRGEGYCLLDSEDD